MSEASTTITPSVSTGSEGKTAAKKAVDSMDLKSLKVIPQGPDTSEIDTTNLESNVVRVEKPVCQVITVKSAPNQTIAVDGTSLKDGGAILSADGKDLIIKYPEGGIIIVEDYFKYAGTATPATVVTDDGIVDDTQIASNLDDEELGQLTPAAGGESAASAVGSAPTAASAPNPAPVADAALGNLAPAAGGNAAHGGGAGFAGPDYSGIGPRGNINIDPLGAGAQFNTGFDVAFEGTGDKVAQTPTIILDPNAIVGDEDNAIPLKFTAHLNDSDGGDEYLTVIIGNMPSGATLSAGTKNSDGTWTLGAKDLPGLTLTPPANSDVDLNLSITAIATERSNGDTASTTVDLPVEVIAVADAPDLTVQNASGDEDTAIALTLDAELTDTDGSETLSVEISGVPTGATLSAGTDNGNGTWTLTKADLAGLTITPPHNSDANFQLTVTARSTEANDGQPFADTVKTIDVNVEAVADKPALKVADSKGDEDTDIRLYIGAGLTDTDGSESLTVEISGVPTGATLSAGTDNGNGTWTLTQAQLANLTIRPPLNSDVDFDLTVTATSTEASNGDTTSISRDINVEVVAVADRPIQRFTSVRGNEDEDIPLNIGSSLTDTDGSETLSVIIGNVPKGATLSAGTDNGNGTWTLTKADLTGLTIRPPHNSDVDFTLTVTSRATEANDGQPYAEVRGHLKVTVDPVADKPDLKVKDAVGDEDTAIALDIDVALTDTDGSEHLGVVIINGVPAGATLSAGSKNPMSNSWSVDAADLPGLTITPPRNSDADFTLQIRAQSFDGTSSAFSDATIDVTVNAVADTPFIRSYRPVTGDEDTPIGASIVARVTDTDGSESIDSIILSGVPAGAKLSAGTKNADGTYTLTKAELSSFTITPPANSDEDFTLKVTVTSIEAANGDTATNTIHIPVTVKAVADAPTLTVTDARGDEDTWIDLDISGALTDTDGSETLTYVVSGVPMRGGSLNHGTRVGPTTYELTEAELVGLKIKPPANSHSDINLTVTARSTEANDGQPHADTVKTIHVTVDAVADKPIINVHKEVGNEDTAIDLHIDIKPAARGEIITDIEISGVPAGATLSAGTETSPGSGVYKLTQAELVGLTITPPADSDADFNLSVKATSTEVTNGDTKTSSENLPVEVKAVADAPTLTVKATASGDEDTAIDLDIDAALTDTDGSETLSIILSGVPAGATLSAGTKNANGTWTLSKSELAGLKITPAANSDQDFTLKVTARSTEANDGQPYADTVKTIDVTVDAVADKPHVHVKNVTGNEDTAINLGINAHLTDTDGSEVLSVEISGVPAGATLSAGTDNGNGTWTLTQAELANLTITPPYDSADDFVLSVKATSTESSNGDTATETNSFKVIVKPIADVPTLVVETTAGGSAVIGTNQTIIGTNASETLRGGAGDDRIEGLGGNDKIYGDGYKGASNVEIDFKKAIANDVDFSEEITAIKVTGVPAGATVSHGTVTNGVWLITDPADIAAILGAGVNVAGVGTVYNGGAVNPTITFPAGTSSAFQLKASVIATDHDTETALTDTESSVETAIDVSINNTYGYGDDLIFGGTGNDIIYGGNGTGAPSGNDTLVGDEGNDKLYGEDGNDGLFGGADNDYLYGGSGNDKLEGGSGHDYLNGGSGTDSLYGGTGDDSLFGSSGDDFLKGEDGGDILHGGTGNDKLYGGNGEDRLFFSYDYKAPKGSVAVNSCSGLTFSFAGMLASYDYYDGGADTDTLYGNNYSSYGDAILYRDAQGNQKIKNVEIIDARNGNDFVNLDNANEAFTVYGGNGHDTIWGGNKADKLYGDSGNDTVYGGKGDDEIFGGTGNDLLVGCDGEDVIKGDAGKDELKGGQGNDKLFGGSENDVIWGNAGNDKIDGGTGVDIAQYAGDVGEFCFSYDFATNEWVVKDRVDDTGVVPVGDEGIDRLVNIENLTFADFDFDLPSGVPNNIIKGTDCGEVLHGDCEPNVIFGLGGNDLLDGGCDDDYLFGGDGNDIVDGECGNDMLFGGAGNDKIFGDSGEDVLLGECGDDWLYGGSENDYLNGGIGNDVLDGGCGDDILNGGYGDDIIYGGCCSDTIMGGAGNDHLWGGARSDTFVFTDLDTKAGVEIDTIYDFTAKGEDQDTINLDAVFDALGIATADRASHVEVTNTCLNKYTVTVFDDANNHSVNNEIFNIAVKSTDTFCDVDEIKNNIDFGSM
jgi:Ca2+-binding RTX toxin-like protein